MTVTYSLNVANTKFNGFAKLLFRWKGSIYKLLYREMLIFCTLYYSLSFLYRYGLKPEHRMYVYFFRNFFFQNFFLTFSACRIFEKSALYCEAFTKLIPLSFVLGFYVSIVVGRWWNQFCAIPWPDKYIFCFILCC